MNSQISKWNMLHLFLAFGLLAGCSSVPVEKAEVAAKVEDVTPAWFSSPPQDDDKYYYGYATATSKDAQLALEKAAADARAEIGRKVELRIEGLQKKFAEEMGTDADAQLVQMFTKSSKLVVSTSLSGSNIKQQKVIRDTSFYRAYSLVAYPIGESSQKLLAQIRNQDQLYTKFRASNTSKELNDEVAQYEEWKKQQAK